MQEKKFEYQNKKKFTMKYEMENNVFFFYNRFLNFVFDDSIETIK